MPGTDAALPQSANDVIELSTASLRWLISNALIQLHDRQNAADPRRNESSRRPTRFDRNG